jgi:hypothetical protein
MATSNDLRQKFSTKDSEELHAMFSKQEEWSKEALEAALLELEARGKKTPKDIIQSSLKEKSPLDENLRVLGIKELTLYILTGLGIFIAAVIAKVFVKSLFNH